MSVEIYWINPKNGLRHTPHEYHNEPGLYGLIDQSLPASRSHNKENLVWESDLEEVAKKIESRRFGLMMAPEGTRKRVRVTKNIQVVRARQVP